MLVIATTTQGTGTRDTTDNLISAVYHALQGVETYQTYAQDAESAGDSDCASFFQQAQQQQQIADRGKQLLGRRLGEGGGRG
jgi:rubrerythrin